MTYFLIPVSMLFGLIIGSFLNALIYRRPHRQTMRGRSQCRTCHKILAWYELIPVISFFIQKGRCRSCGTALSLQYPLVEIGTALSYAGVASLWTRMCAQNPSLVCATPAVFFLTLTGIWIAIAAAIVVIVIDIRHFIILDGAVMILAILGIGRIAVGFFLSSPGAPRLFLAVSDLAAALGAALLLGAIWFFSRGRAMGFGDVKLIFATSLITGFPLAIPAFIFSFWLGGAVGLILLLAGRKKLKSKIPFGPFIILGAAAALIFAPQIHRVWGW